MRRVWPIRFPSAKFWNKARKERIALMENRKKLRVGIPRVLNIYTYAPLFNGYLRKPGRAAGEHRLLRLHQLGAVPRGREPRRHRSLLPGEDRHLARLQPDSGKASQEAAQRHLLPDVRRADFAAGQDCRRERLPHCDRDAGNGEGGVHQRE